MPSPIIEEDSLKHNLAIASLALPSFDAVRVVGVAGRESKESSSEETEPGP